MVAALIFAVSSLGMAMSPSLGVFITLRFMAGIGVGMASILSPMYIAEVSPAHVRGRNVAINQLTIVIGILVTNLVNYSIAGSGPEAWRWMFGLGCIPSLLFFAGVFFLPESPRYLVKAGKPDQALRVLKKIGNGEFAQSTMNNIEDSMKGAHNVPFREVFNKAVRPAVMIGVGLAVFQQFCGINVVFNYTSTIFESVGADLNRQLFETVSIGVVNLIFTILAMLLVDRLGRHPLMLFGAAGLAVSYLILSTLLRAEASPLFISIFVLTYIAIYGTSLAPVTWVLISEIFPNRIRGKASSLAVVSLWGAYFVLVFTFPILAETLGAYGPFYLYAAICVGGFFFIKFRVRETKGKTLEELEEVMARHA